LADFSGDNQDRLQRRLDIRDFFIARKARLCTGVTTRWGSFAASVDDAARVMCFLQIDFVSSYGASDCMRTLPLLS
jgi:hypothetical protein